jgi:hypothetical protein
MKSFSSVAKSMLPDSIPRIVHFIADIGTWKKLELPTMSSDLTCLVCGSSIHYAVFCDPTRSDKRVRICAKGDCVTNTSMIGKQTTTIQPDSQRAILWPKFCEFCGMGDLCLSGIREDLLGHGHVRVVYA